MNGGLKIINDNGGILIDSTFMNYRAINTFTLGSYYFGVSRIGNYGLYIPTNRNSYPNTPLAWNWDNYADAKIFNIPYSILEGKLWGIKCNSSLLLKTYCKSATRISRDTIFYCSTGDDISSLQITIFDKSYNKSSAQAGLRVYNENRQLIYDSGYKDYARCLGILNMINNGIIFIPEFFGLEANTTKVSRILNLFFLSGYRVENGELIIEPGISPWLRGYTPSSMYHFPVKNIKSLCFTHG